MIKWVLLIIMFLVLGSFYPFVHNYVFFGDYKTLVSVVFLIFWFIILLFSKKKFFFPEKDFNIIFIIQIFCLFFYTIFFSTSFMVLFYYLLSWIILVFVLSTFEFDFFFKTLIKINIISLILCVIGLTGLSFGIVKLYGVYNYQGSFDILNFGLYFMKKSGDYTNIRPAGYYDEPGSFAYIVMLLLLINRRYFKNQKLRLFSPTFSLKKSLPYVKGVYVRSDYESLFFSKSMNLNQDKIFKIMLPYDSNIEHSTSKVTKEKFCLHISSIYQERKNVIRLIKAAKKYNFNLILAGFKGADHEFEPLKREIGNSDNIKVLGFISKEEMIDLYERAKVFALPSISEGVGMVAIDAAAYGCDIVITNIGGPKEYYNNMAEIVNPFDIDEIGKSIKKLLTDNTYQPNLQKYIHTKFNKSLIAESLEATYLKVVAD